MRLAGQDASRYQTGCSPTRKMSRNLLSLAIAASAVLLSALECAPDRSGIPIETDKTVRWPESQAVQGSCWIIRHKSIQDRLDCPKVLAGSGVGAGARIRQH